MHLHRNANQSFFCHDIPYQRIKINLKLDLQLNRCKKLVGQAQIQGRELTQDT
jgi:hypothetical protein